MSTDGLFIGVVSDTHVPDRVAGLHPDILSELKKAGVTQIFHAGDICIPSVLEALTTVAPVIAVRGNRDWLFAGKLPWRRDFEMAGVKFAMMHGMGNWGKYLEYKVRHALNGYVLNNYLPMMCAAAPKADVIIFGHTHFPEIIWEDGQLVFNPGSAGPGRRRGWKPTFGLLKVLPDGRVEAEIRELA
jgi:putative phosphoesterase